MISKLNKITPDHLAQRSMCNSVSAAWLCTAALLFCALCLLDYEMKTVQVVFSLCPDTQNGAWPTIFNTVSSLQ